MLNPCPICNVMEYSRQLANHREMAICPECGRFRIIDTVTGEEVEINSMTDFGFRFSIVS